MKDASPKPRGRGMAEGMLEGMVEGGRRGGVNREGGAFVDLWVIKNRLIGNIVISLCPF